MLKTICLTPSDAAEKAASFLAKTLNDLSSKKNPILLLVSGGSAFNVLDSVQLPKDGSGITIGVLDERFSTDSLVNNFSQFKQTLFYRNSLALGCTFFDSTVRNDETQEQLRDRFEEYLKKWISENNAGKIVITQGIGADTHTSGILPFPEDSEKFNRLFNNPERLVASYDAENKNQYPLRVTTTMTFLRKVDFSWVYVCGQEKRSALENTLSDSIELHRFPSQIIREMKDVHIFTDIH